MLALDAAVGLMYFFCSLDVPHRGAVVIPFPVVPQAASAAGLPARYLYWCGRSGRRYLFTATDAAGIADFGEGVAIAAVDGRIVWTGEIAALAFMLLATGMQRASFYVHLLASTREERRAVMADLRPIDGAHLRLAA